MYCSEHRFAPPPPPSLPTPLPSDQFTQGLDMSMKGYVAPDGMMGFHATPLPIPNPQPFPPQQWADVSSLFTPPQTLLHPSQSAPNFQTNPPQHQAVQANPLAPPPALLPEGERCIYPMCNKRRYKEDDGKMHNFCGRYHATEYKKLKGESFPPEMKCKTPGCTRQKRARDEGGGYYDYCGRSCRDGSFRTKPAGIIHVHHKFFSAAGEKCSLPGCDKPRFVDPASGRVHDYCGITHANQATIQSGGVSQVCSVRLLSPGEQGPVQSHFSSQWAKGKGACPTITCAFEITNQQLETRWNTYKQSLPRGSQCVEKYYHGTKLKCDIVNAGNPCNDNDCGICGISKFGMFRKFIRRNINFQRFGHGFYFAPNSSKCHDYTQGVQTHRAMLLVEILPGKKHTILSNDVKLTNPPDGCHSVFGKQAKPSTTQSWLSIIQTVSCLDIS
ncbi:hypothetical protein GBAR_LOCUS11341 [Geodia barretti]|uniref:PARP catalytic domain-containing protein n=1 Tax=Geodia barretti TaxID=519541 RepID=A0AA35WER3_GEOBA|nr:hypothetical protein GBAR_LOCUS11341 [Geodia barretti]